MGKQKVSTSLLNWFLRLAGIGLFAVILSRSNVSGIASNLKNMDMSYALTVLVLVSIGACIRAYRWTILMQHDIKIKFRHVLRSYFIGIFIGMLTPARIGEYSKAVYISRHYPGMFKNLLSALVDRYIELLGFLIVSGVIVGQFIAQPREGDSQLFSYYLWGVVGFFCLLVAGWLLLRPITLLCRKVAASFGLHGTAEKFEQIMVFIKRVSPLTLLVSLILTFFFWLVFMLMYILIARGLDIHLEPVQICFSAVLATLTVMLPISIGGIGTREAALVYVFKLFGQPSEKAISLGIAVFAYYILFVFIGFIMYLSEKLAKAQ